MTKWGEMARGTFSANKNWLPEHNDEYPLSDRKKIKLLCSLTELRANLSLFATKCRTFSPQPVCQNYCNLM
jgi:hypothetical protein